MWLKLQVSNGYHKGFYIFRFAVQNESITQIVPIKIPVRLVGFAVERASRGVKRQNDTRAPALGERFQPSKFDIPCSILDIFIRRQNCDTNKKILINHQGRLS